MVHDLTGTVLGVIDDPQQVREAVSALTAAGFETEVLHGDQGRAHLSPEDEEGEGGKAQRLAIAFGDQTRILDRMNEVLGEGHSVVSVDVESDRADEVATILQENGGREMWRLGEWSFNRIGAEDDSQG